MNPAPTPIRRAARSVLVLAGLGLSLAACEEDLLNDPTFRTWCGDDKLCAWDIDAGRISRVPTWHEDDGGVSMLETPTVIGQTLKSSPKCLAFTMVADVEARAQVSIEIDFNGDGKVDWTYPVPEVRWRQWQTLITAPKAYRHARFSIRKAGTGRAVIAEMRLVSKDKCAEGAKVELRDLPIGSACGSGAECRSGICCGDPRNTALVGPPVCSECCPGGTVCDGAGCGATACTGAGQKCGAPRCMLLASPFLCNAQLRTGATGAPCADGTDCASGVCDGAKATPLQTAPCPNTTDKLVIDVLAGTCR